jgi:DNA primase catalytic subunit
LIKIKLPKQHTKQYKTLTIKIRMEEPKKEIKEEKPQEKREISEKEIRIRKITKLYYSNPKIQEAILNFSQNREVVPRYFEGFGKRPDTIQYSSDIMGLVNKGATSFHCSEELWNDPLQLSTDLSPDELNKLRKSWDLLIDIDSPYLDLSNIAAKLIVKALESHGIKNYGLKFSGSKGFHIIVSGNAFPEEYEGMKMKESFPDWPRAITEYLFSYIRREYNLEAGKMMSFSNLEDKEKPEEKIWDCLNCGRQAKQGNLITFHCPVCDFTMERRDSKISKRRLRCLNPGCAGELEIQNKKPYFFCEFCKTPNSELPLSSDKNPELFEEMRGEDAGKYGKLDLVLVAPRHLFRMPYSLHEKTSLSSAVLSKEQLNNFSPKDASPFTIQIREFMPKNEKDEAKTLLREALRWKKTQTSKEEEEGKRISKDYKPLDNSQFKDVPEDFFPAPIKKLLNGLQDGKKRGLFILITFLRALNFSPEYINNKIRDWNKLNSPPLKEGYIRSQIEWHLKQRKLILPPNYDNESFYKDLNLLDKKPETKNPIVDVSRMLWKNR